jgi:hypothetical protein
MISIGELLGLCMLFSLRSQRLFITAGSGRKFVGGFQVKDLITVPSG